MITMFVYYVFIPVHIWNIILLYQIAAKRIDIFIFANLSLLFIWDDNGVHMCRIQTC